MAGNTPSGRNASEVLGLVRPNIRGLQPYVGGAQITSYEEWTKLNQNEFPYPPAPGVVAVKDRFNEKGFVSRYPPGDHRELKSKLAPHLDIEPGQISFGNGSDEALQNVALVFLREGDTIAYMRPDYSMWPIYEQLAGASPAIIDLPDDYRLPVGKVAAAGAKLTFFSNPNTPSGALTPVEEVRRLCEELYPNVVVADEAYVDFAEADVLGLVRSGDHPNLIVSRTFSKAYGLAGLRLGYVTGNPDVISRVEAVRLPYNVNPVTYAAGLATLEPDSMAYYKTLIELTKSER
ncbi:MAG: histidinol-phosphate aminotransferase family protein, partial [Candidatus Aenigmarchaeota archaeon]|nr:histidinol-phosphate aminotransferase family protein [Candidatus Aenigmarchaeota archaeon]